MTISISGPTTPHPLTQARIQPKIGTYPQPPNSRSTKVTLPPSCIWVGAALKEYRVQFMDYRDGSAAPTSRSPVPLFTLPRVGLALRANLAASRGLRPHSVLCTPYSVIYHAPPHPSLRNLYSVLDPALCPLFRYSPFHRCTGAPLRFPPFHGYLSALRTLHSILCTPYSVL